MKNKRLPLQLIACVLSLWLASCGSPGAVTGTGETSPQLVYQVPSADEELPLNGSITLSFDRPMDRQSVEKAISIDPAIAYQAQWQDNLTLTINPEAGVLSRATHYRIIIDKSAKSRDGLALDGPILAEVNTVGYLSVSEVVPAPGSADIDPSSVITVLFNHPVMPLSVDTKTAPNPHPLHFEPDIPGYGEWVNSSIYIWHPAGDLPGGQAYHASIDPNILTSTDAVMRQSYDWTFSTIAPAVTWHGPPSSQQDIALDNKVEVHFNQAMDRASAEAGFSMTGSARHPGRDDGSDSWQVPGSFEWNANSDDLTFTPDQSLAYNSVYEVNVGKAARAQHGAMRIADETSWQFVTVKSPAVVGTAPTDNAQDVSPVYGWFYIAFASPMNPKTVLDKLVVDPPLPEHAAIYYDDTRQYLMVEAEFKPSADYTVTLRQGAADPYGRKIEQPYTFHFKTGPFPGLVNLNLERRLNVYDVRQMPQILAFVRNVDRVDLELVRLSQQDFWRLSQDRDDLLSSFQPDRSQIARSWSITTQSPLNIGYNWKIPLKLDDGTIPEPGIYLLILSSPDLKSDIRNFIFLTNANITSKTSFKQSLAWVTDLRTGMPLNNVGVTFFDKNFQQIGQGNTDTDGVVQVDTALQPQLNDPRAVIAQGNGIFGIDASNWSENIDPWSLGVSLDSTYRPHGLYLYTDRPIYRPGQQVHFKGILRNKDDLKYTLPDVGQVQVTIQSSDSDTVYSENLPVSDFGTFDGTFDLGPDAATGYYNIKYKLDTKGDQNGQDYYDYHDFWVAEYEKPQFTVTVTPEQKSVSAGDMATVTVDAHHFFGGPVSQGWVTWRAYSQPYRLDYNGPEAFSFLNYDREQPVDDNSLPGYGQDVAEGSGWLDKDGHLTIKVPTDLSKFNSSQQVTIEALAGDGSGQWVAGEGRVIIHKSATYVGIRPESYVGATGTPQNGYVITLDPDEKPVAKQTVKVQVIQRRWYSVQEVTDSGYTYWNTNVQETPVSTQYVTTDEQGRAQFSFVPRIGGSYKLTATVSDAKGRTVTSNAYMWTGDADYLAWGRHNDRSTQIVPDKSSYKSGDTARILIASPFAGRDVRALVTVERGSILYHQVITLKDTSNVYELPITADFAPNAFVSVVIQQNATLQDEQPDFRVGYAEIQVQSVSQALQVSVTPDKAEAKPGESVTYTVTTHDASGKPVDAEVSLALVDLATLALRDDSNGTLLDYFYRHQYLGVVTGLSLVNLVAPLDKALLDQAKGGGGGGAEGFYDVRSDFKDTAYWQAAVRTGSTGSTTVTVTLPDNLTTWRMDARAVTANTLVGQATTDVVASRPLMVQPVTPRFFVAGDDSTLGAIVFNQTSKDIDATVNLTGSGVSLHNNSEQHVTIPANGQARVEWPVTVNADAGWIDLTFGAKGGGLNDSSKPLAGDPAHSQMLPVYRYASPDTVGTAGQLSGQGTRTEHIVLPPGSNSPQGQVDVHIDNSLAASMVDGLTWLEDYPYECTEQTVSRFLPNVLTLNALHKVGRSEPELEKQLKTQMDIGIQKLYNQQHVDGGWGWFVDRESDPGVSAYVLQGLVAAKSAGYPVDQGRFDRAVAYVQGQLQAVDALKAISDRNRQVYMLYVLAKAGQPDVSRTVQTYDARLGLDLWSRALLAQTLWMIDPHDTRLDSLKSDLVNAADLTSTGAHWQEAQDDYWNWNTNTRTTAIVLDTFAQLWPTSDLAPNITRWLMASRVQGHWATTQETSWALIALTDWMTATHELEANYQWTLSLNGSQLADGTADSNTVTGTRTVTFEASSLNQADTNKLVFQHGSGAGQMYYTAHLTIYQPVDSLKPLGRGIVVTRQYLGPNGKPTTEGQVGDIVTVKLTIVAPDDLHYVVVDDYYPAGAEAINQDLNTTGKVGQRPYLSPDDPLANGWGWWWFSHVDLRDEKAQVFADYLPAGTYQFIYRLRLTVPGTYHVLPPTGQEFYFPEVYGRGAGSLFSVVASGQ